VAHDDFDEDSDWTAHARHDEAQPSRRPQQIALVICGMALGAAAASAAWFVASKAARPAPAPIVLAAPAAGPAAVTVPAPAPAVVVAPPPAPAPRVTETADAPPAPAASAPRAMPALSAAEVARRKELAWSRFYKRPPTCEGNPTADQLIDCANHFIRAKREFDERWRTGTL
jgi:hypothetical protein